MSLGYLSKYLNKDTTKSKKRKRQNASVVVDDLTGWSNELATGVEETPVMVETRQVDIAANTGFRPAYAHENPQSPSNGTAASLEITSPRESMQGGSSAGLQTRAQVAAATKLHNDAQLQKYRASVHSSKGREHETIYRDATGRRIDIALAKQEKAKEHKRLQLDKEKEKTMQQGLVQQRAREARLIELDKVRSESFSRYAGHAETEAALKGKMQWNDPAAGLVNHTHIDSRPLYRGGFAPNRFAIRPGYRWDGVDRGTGYEAKRFREMASLNQKKSEYSDWAKEDM